MDNSFFSNTEEFLQLFPINDTPYEHVVHFAGDSVGFSVKRAYPANIRFIPAKKKDGTPDVVAIIGVVYARPSESKKKIEPNKVPIFLHIAVFSRYLNNRFDYDFEDDNCPTEDSVRDMKNSPRPIDLESYDYHFNHESGRFFSEDDGELTGLQLIDKLFEQHCDTVRLLKGLTIHWKLRSRDFTVGLCSWIAGLNIWLLRQLFGRTLESEENAFTYLQGYKKDDLKKLSIESLNILGHKASKNVIITFSVFLFLLYIYIYLSPFEMKFFEKLYSINLFSVAFVILALWIMDDIMPRIILKIINGLIRIRTYLHFRQFRL